jgi:MFS family permease
MMTQITSYFTAVLTVTFSCLQIILFMLLPFFSEHFAISLSQTIAYFSFGSFLFLFSSPYWSSRSDQVGRFKVLSWAILGLAISIALLIFFKNSTSLLISRIMYGLFASAIVPVLFLIRLDFSSAQNQLAPALTHSTLLNLGRFLGPALFIFFPHQYLLIGILILTLPLFIFSLFLKETAMVQSSTFDFKKMNKEMLWIFILALGFSTHLGLLYSSLAAIIQSKLVLSSTQSATLMAKILMFCTGLMIFSQSTAKAVFKNNWKSSLKIGVATLLIGSIYFAWTITSLDLWIAISMISIGFSLIQPSYLAALRMNQGLSSGLISSMQTLGYALGGFLVSIFLTTSLSIIYIAVALLIAISAILVMKPKLTEELA